MTYQQKKTLNQCTRREHHIFVVHPWRLVVVVWVGGLLNRLTTRPQRLIRQLEFAYVRSDFYFITTDIRVSREFGFRRFWRLSKSIILKGNDFKILFITFFNLWIKRRCVCGLYFLKLGLMVIKSFKTDRKQTMCFCMLLQEEKCNLF